MKRYILMGICGLKKFGFGFTLCFLFISCASTEIYDDGSQTPKEQMSKITIPYGIKLLTIDGNVVPWSTDPRTIKLPAGDHSFTFVLKYNVTDRLYGKTINASIPFGCRKNLYPDETYVVHGNVNHRISGDIVVVYGKIYFDMKGSISLPIYEFNIRK